LVYLDKRILEFKDRPHIAMEFMKSRDDLLESQKTHKKNLAKLTRHDTDGGGGEKSRKNPPGQTAAVHTLV